MKLKAIKRGKFFRFSVVLTALIVSISFFSLLTQAAFGASLEDELKQVKEQISNKEGDVSDAEARIVDVSDEIDAVNNKIDEKQAEIDAIEAQIKDVNKQITKAEKDLAKKQKEMEEQINILDDRLVDYYVNGHISYLEVLFDATSFSDMINRAKYISLIVKQDNDLIKKIDEEQAKIEALKEQLEAQKAELKELEEQQLAAKQELVDESKAKEKLLADIEAELNDYEEELAELEDEAEALASKIAAQSTVQRTAKSSSGDTVIGEGVLTWPLPGYTYISSYFGYRIHPIYGDSRFHSGVDIPAPEGVSVLAVDGGTVSYSGWNGGFGNCVMIDHGNGMVSLYGHMSAIYVSEGQSVSRGQSVGAVGTTGTSTGDHLHLSIYINGELVDPLSYY